MNKSSVTRLESIEASDYDLSPETMHTLRTSLAGFLDASQIITDPEQCFQRSNTDWAPAKPNQKPAVVVTPKCTDDVSKVLNLCCRLKVPVTSCSGRTSLTGSLLATRGGGLCVDFGLMDKILAVYAEDQDAVVQPGVGWRKLQDALSPAGLFFPPDPGPKACIGGMISTSCAGTNAYRYGTMKEWVIGLTVVLADGTVVKTKRRPRKSSAGYDLTHLMVGAEGTLGLVTEATIKLAPAPKNQRVAIATFPDPRSAMRAGLELMTSGHTYDALELLDQSSMRAVNGAGWSERRWSEKPTLFLKISGPRTSVADAIEATRIMVGKHGCLDFEATEDEAQQKVCWDARKLAGPAFYETREDPDAKYLCSDSAVPVSKVADLMDKAYEMSDALDIPNSVIVHLGDGNVHCQVLASPAKFEAGKRLISDIELAAVDMDGTISGEHGIGTTRQRELVYELGDNAVDLMRSIKLALDPNRILNPDKVFRLDP